MNYIIQNIKDINLEKINKEINDEIKDRASKNNNFYYLSINYECLFKIKLIIFFI